jgi:hypothetical protein
MGAIGTLRPLLQIIPRYKYQPFLAKKLLQTRMAISACLLNINP